jgi:hypothetical protein
MALFRLALDIEQKYKDLLKELICVALMAIFVIGLHGFSNNTTLTAWELFVYSIVGKLFNILVFSELIEIV